MNKPTTAVIGAGISGLTAGKMLADYGVPYTCFESSDRIGGNWAFGNPNGHSSAYRSLHIDTSKHQLSFKDFPMPDDYPDFPHHTLIKQYLDDYTDAFGLREKIEFGNGITHAHRLDGGGWELSTQRGETRYADLLVVGQVPVEGNVGAQVGPGRGHDLHQAIGARGAAHLAAEARFLRRIRDDACRIFGTTLSPDYNAVHHDHLHLEAGRPGLCS